MIGFMIVLVHTAALVHTRAWGNELDFLITDSNMAFAFKCAIAQLFQNLPSKQGLICYLCQYKYDLIAIAMDIFNTDECLH